MTILYCAIAEADCLLVSLLILRNQTMLNSNRMGTNDGKLLQFLDASSPATQHENDKASNLLENSINDF